MNKEKDLSDPIQYIKGVGPFRSKLLARLGIHTLRDALFYLPYRYEDRSSIKKIIHLKPDELNTVIGRVLKTNIRIPQSYGSKKPKIKIFELTISDGSGIITAKWFNQPYLEKVFKLRDEVVLYGIVKLNYWATGLEMPNPEYELLSDDESMIEQSNIHTGRIVPIYRLTEGLSQKQMRNIMHSVLGASISFISDPLPIDIIQSQKLLDLRESIENVHFPSADVSIEELNKGVTPYHKRLVFGELFTFQVGLAMMKKGDILDKGISFKPDNRLSRPVLSNLLFELTAAQKRVFGEIIKDMESNTPMNRLIQGDVGSGKTIVSVLSMLACVESGYQAALMAPTEILAEQHHINISHMLEQIGLKVQLITGSKKMNSKKKIAKVITADQADIIIGTHALIQENVHFEKLGLVIIDEQHRFGVMQRASLRKKGLNPDTIVMTATPIPRTLALTLYGDLDYSIIDELPPNRSPIITILLDKKKENQRFRLIEEEIKKGGQVYVVYPLIEESEKIDLESAIAGAEEIQKRFPHLMVGLLHGRMKADEREAVMQRFKEGAINILVSTTVIEVGVDVPNATLMVIMNAERFGLAQLHQLRGRVGRGSSQSYCVLLQHKTNEDARKRLEVMVRTTDGFIIAEEDLNIRGHGEFLGTKQSGLPDFKITNLFRDAKVLEEARREAFSFIEKNSSLENYPGLRKSLQDFWGKRIELLKIA